MNDILSAHSYAKPGGAFGQENLYSPQLGASPGGAQVWDDNVDGGDQQYRQQQFSGALLGELASQKSKYNRKLVSLEKACEQLRAEKT